MEVLIIHILKWIYPDAKSLQNFEAFNSTFLKISIFLFKCGLKIVLAAFSLSIGW
jgi:hypothetical protein